MSFLEGQSVWVIAALIFFVRICDVSLGTLRTISVVHGRLRLSFVLGFFEVLLWITAISQVIFRIREHPLPMVAYAGGFAMGNAIGITLERKLALGQCVVRMISRRGNEISERVQGLGTLLAVIDGDGDHGSPTTLLYAICARRDLPQLLATAREVDSDLIYVVERFSETSLTPAVGHRAPFPNLTGWRAILSFK